MKNIILQGDNLKMMDLLADGLDMKGKIDFIYIDPPYFSNTDYKTYTDKWDGGIEEYLQTLVVRIRKMKELLSPTGVIAVHLDWHSVHYVKVEMDRVFGYNRFINELIWSYKSGGASKKFFARKHDTILVYSKSPKYTFNPQKEKSYNRGYKPYRFKGVEEFCDEEGRWYTMVNHRDIINVDMVGRTSAERTGYATQKPEKLLKLLIESFTNEGDLCADFYAGSGSLAAAAYKSGRQFISCDSSPDATEIAYSRLAGLGADIELIKE